MPIYGPQRGIQAFLWTREPSRPESDVRRGNPPIPVRELVRGQGPRTRFLFHAWAAHSDGGSWGRLFRPKNTLASAQLQTLTEIAPFVFLRGRLESPHRPGVPFSEVTPRELSTGLTGLPLPLAGLVGEGTLAIATHVASQHVESDRYLQSTITDALGAARQNCWARTTDRAWTLVGLSCVIGASQLRPGSRPAGRVAPWLPVTTLIAAAANLTYGVIQDQRLSQTGRPVLPI